MKQHIWTWTAVFSLGSFLWLVPALSAAENEMDLTTFVIQYEAAERQLLAVLDEESLWNDAARRENLLECLQAARLLRMPSLAPVLVKHLTYTASNETEEDRRLTVEARFPVMRVLQNIGLPAAPALLDVLKSANPEDRLGSGQQAHNLAMHCLITIYAQGGHGITMARHRLQSEIQNASGKEKAFLERALDHPRLKQN